MKFADHTLGAGYSLGLMKITTYIGSWPQNIGNAFFDLGAEAMLRRVAPDAEIVRTGGAVHWMFNNSRTARRSKIHQTFRNLIPSSRTRINGNSIELGAIAKSDLFVFAGMSVCREFAENNGRTLLEASRRGIPILGLGVGASQYLSCDVAPFIEMFRKIDNFTLVTRDEETFQLIGDLLPHVYRGIDSAFFLPWGFRPTALDIEPFVVSAFDSIIEPEFIARFNPIRTHHDLWGPLPRRYTNLPRTLVSDIPEDYLNLYASGIATYSDRVHACVASLAFGNEAQLFSKTRRSGLFDEVGASNILEKMVKLDMRYLESRRIQQADRVKAILTELGVLG